MATGKTEAEESKNNKVYTREDNNPKDSTFVPQQSSLQTLATTTTTDDNNSSQQLPRQLLDVVASDYSSYQTRVQQGAQNATNRIATDGYVKYDNKISLNVLSKNEVRVSKRKLGSELELDRGLVKNFEAKKCRFSGVHANSRVSGNGNVDRGAGSLARVNSDVGSVGLPGSRPSHGLSVSVTEHDNSNHGGGGSESEFVEKEKRTPEANQYYKNSEFVLGKEKLKAMESNKKMKPNVGMKNGDQMGVGIATEEFSSQLFKSCRKLLDKLMKHKFGWLFNQPVDAKRFGCHDYHSIVKHPMDLGTVKTRLNKNWYKSPKEFAEDVRLTFSNAMLYNPKGHKVHFAADMLLGKFAKNWASIESEYRSFESSHDYNLPTPSSRRILAPIPATAPVQAHAPTLITAPAPSPVPLGARSLERSESMTTPDDPNFRAVGLTPTGGIAVPIKPNVGMKNGDQMGVGIATEEFSSQMFQSSRKLLDKLMKHKSGWMFNQPVDAKRLGCHDYHSIVKHPMDLGTVKTRLNKNWYKSPKEFAEDVRLTFNNAMLYNPKGHEVHFAADMLLGKFAKNWVSIESEYRSFESSHDYNLPTPSSRRILAPILATAPVQAHAPTLITAPAPSPVPLGARSLERSESMTTPDDPNFRAVGLTPAGGIAVPIQPNVGKKNGDQMGVGIATEEFSSQLFKSCRKLLDKLMKHKSGWMFNQPVDAKRLGCHDYHSIVKHPMDLGTVKTRLNKNWYKSPKEFAEDVRLTFSNAMLYNPKGHEVHFAADMLLGKFAKNWASIESEYRSFESSHDYNLPTPSSRRIVAPIPATAPVQAHAPTLVIAPAPSPVPLGARSLERSESMTTPIDPNFGALGLTPTGKDYSSKESQGKGS